MQHLILIALAILAIALTGTIAWIVVSLPWILGSLAKRQVLVAFCEDGTAKLVVDRGGKFKHAIMVYTGFHLNDPRKTWYDASLPDWEIVRDEPGKKYDDRHWLVREAGVYWVGIPPFRRVHWYAFEWNEMRLNTETKKEEVWSRREKTDFIYIKPFNYATVMENVENADGIPLSILYMTTIAIKNPFKALFRAVSWLSITNASTGREAKNFIGGSTYDELKNEEAARKSGKSGNFSLPIVELTNHLPDDAPAATDCGLHARYGVTIQTADLQSFDPPESLRAATVLRYQKQEEAAGVEALGRAQATVAILKGKADARVVILKGVGEGAALRARIRALRDSGRMGELLLQTDAMMAQGPSSKVIWANNPFINSNGLSDILDPLGITPQQLKEVLASFVQKDKESTAA